jgi:hypothetical protein
MGKIFLWFGGAEFLNTLRIVFDDNSRDSSGIHFLIAFTLLLLGFWIDEREQIDEQAERTRKATEIRAKLASGESVNPYSLYLRPFSTTSRLRTSNPDPRTLGATPSTFYILKTLELENVLAKALNSFAPLITLNTLSRELGAGKIAAAASDWQEVVRILALHATVILVIPGYQAGTKWEVGWLKEKQHLYKTIFLMPHAVDVPNSEFDVATHWVNTSIALHELGLTIPEYCKEGMMFTLKDSGEVAQSKQIGKMNMDSSEFWITSVKSVLSHHKSNSCNWIEGSSSGM